MKTFVQKLMSALIVGHAVTAVSAIEKQMHGCAIVDDVQIDSLNHEFHEQSLVVFIAAKKKCRSRVREVEVSRKSRVSFQLAKDISQVNEFLYLLWGWHQDLHFGCSSGSG